MESATHRGGFATMSLNGMAKRLNISAAGSAANRPRHAGGK